MPAGAQGGEIQVDQDWVLEVAWSPTAPGVFASACFGDGRSDTVRMFLPCGFHFTAGVMMRAAENSGNDDKGSSKDVEILDF